MASITTLAGFGGLLLAGHQGLRSIGDVAILGIVATTAVAVVVLPAAMSALESRVRGTGFGLLPTREFERPGESD